MFESARIKLTLWYILIIMLISLCFSMVIFDLFREVERFAALQRLRMEEKFKDVYVIQPGTRLPQPVIVSFSEDDLVQELKSRLINMLILVNGTILVVSGGISYLFAGKTLRPIKEMVNEQHRFISDASHELRTPLTSLRSAFEVYSRDKKQTLPEARVVITESLEEVKNLQQLSDSLLQLAQYHKPNGHTQFEKTNLNKTLETALRRMKPVAVQKEIALKYEPQELSVFGHADSLTNLWVILIDNAIKYSPEKSTITVQSVKKDSSAIVTIQDQGIGIEPKELYHIFDRFYRANSARSKNGAGGYGLGLSIAKKIVDQHKGQIYAKSTPNEGTTFVVKLGMK